MSVRNALLPEKVRQVVEDPARQLALSALYVHGGSPDGDFERISRLVAAVFGTEAALVTLIDNDKQVLLAATGAKLPDETPLDHTFCAHTLALEEGVEALIVLDADVTSPSTRPIYLGSDKVRFYVGAPISVGGHRVGTVAVASAVPRTSVDPALVTQLVDLASLASTLLALKDEARVRARTAAALMREEWRHALTLEAGKVGSWVWEFRTGEIVCNEMFRRMYGLPEVDVVQINDVIAATHPTDRAVVEAGLLRSLQEGEEFEAETRISATGRWVTMRGRVYQRDASGKPLVMMGVSIDISEGKIGAEHTRLLLRELNHRVKNTLAMIHSVARQTIRQNPDPRNFIDAFSGRLRTISDAHVLLADRDWTGIQLYEVIASQLGPEFLSRADRADVRGQDISLPADHALGLGLILHELTTNAHRYGAWSKDKGVVHIDWSLAEKPVRGLSLRWREEGGPTVAQPDDIGLGVKLIERSLAKVLDSEVKLNFDPSGVKADVWIPLPLENG